MRIKFGQRLPPVDATGKDGHQLKSSGRKLVVTISALNEEPSIGDTLSNLPCDLPDFERIEVLVVDDGSDDATLREALAHGADYVLRLASNRGLGTAFALGLETALRLGADVIVHTDADDQFPGEDIRRLVQPIASGQADLAIGARRDLAYSGLTPGRRLCHRLGRMVIGFVAGSPTPDPVSGFRALSRQMATQLVVTDRHSYTLGTLIQAARQGSRVAWVPITTKKALRLSRVTHRLGRYIFFSGISILRACWRYRRGQFVALMALVSLVLGAAGAAKVAPLATPVASLVDYGTATMAIGAVAGVVMAAAAWLLLRLNRRDTRVSANDFELIAADAGHNPRAKIESAALVS